jgi:pimeloyl-ACP methyl ester carboxylesterase
MLVVALTLSALGVTVFGGSAPAATVRAAEGTTPTIPKFYDAPSPLPKGKPGDLIRTQEIKAPAGARAWRILYRSTLHDGKPVAVSGFVVVPDGPAPKEGRPVVAWAHGTDGGARRCAPSLIDDPARDLLTYFTFESPYQYDVGIPALSAFVKAGYVVVATDYQGLGTSGVHQYAVGSTEARGVLDSARAIRQLSAAHASKNVVVLGWSQGGGASLFSWEDAR